MANSKTKLLIVTDSPNQLLALSEYLGYEYEVLTARNGEEGFTLFSQYKRRISVLITDLKTLKKSVLKLLTNTKQQYPALQIIIIKPEDTPPLHDELSQRQAITYVEEPFEYASLKSSIDKAVKRSASATQPDDQTLNLLDLLQLYSLSEAKVALTVVRDTAHGKEQGNIYFEEGEITNAICGKRRGKAAFACILHWGPGRFITRYGVVAKHKEVELPWQILYHEALQMPPEAPLEEEERSILSPVPSDDTTFPLSATDMLKDKPEPPTGDSPGEPVETTSSGQLDENMNKAVREVLGELELESGELDCAVVQDRNGELVSTAGTADYARASALHDIMGKVLTFYEHASTECETGPLDEAIILAQRSLMLLYPIGQQQGAISVSTLKEDQGMMRWNCREAVEKLEGFFD